MQFNSCNKKDIIQYIFYNDQIKIINDITNIQYYACVKFRIMHDIDLLRYTDYNIAYPQWDNNTIYIIKSDVNNIIKRYIYLFSLLNDGFIHYYIDIKQQISGLSIITNREEWNLAPIYEIQLYNDIEIKKFINIYYKKMQEQFKLYIDYNYYNQYMYKCINYCKAQLLLMEL